MVSGARWAAPRADQRSRDPQVRGTRPSEADRSRVAAGLRQLGAGGQRLPDRAATACCPGTRTNPRRGTASASTGSRAETGATDGTTRSATTGRATATRSSRACPTAAGPSPTTSASSGAVGQHGQSGRLCAGWSHGRCATATGACPWACARWSTRGDGAGRWARHGIATDGGWRGADHHRPDAATPDRCRAADTTGIELR